MNKHSFYQNPLGDVSIAKFVTLHGGNIHNIEKLVLNVFEFAYKEQSMFGRFAQPEDLFFQLDLKKFYKANCFPTHYNYHANQEDVDDIFEQDWIYIEDNIPTLLYVINRFVDQASKSAGQSTLANNVRFLFSSNEDGNILITESVEETDYAEKLIHTHRERRRRRRY